MPVSNTPNRWPEFAAYVGLARGAWLVLTHDNPDPDALASAAVLARILRAGFRRSATIAYGGIVGRAENREMVRSLGLQLKHVRTLDWSRYRHFALVDTQPRTGNNQLPDALVPDVVIDHHPLRRATHGAPFFDVRTQYGATATIVAEYAQEAGVALPRSLATALVYALRSETQDFFRSATEHDKAAYDEFLPRVDKRALARILYPRLPMGYFRNLHEALGSLESVNTLVISHLGGLEQPDIVPEIADLLLRLEGKTWSLCTGSFGDRLYLSIRTTNPRADAGRLMRRLLARRGKGGGHGVMAGGWLPIAKASAGEVLTLQRQIAARLAQALGKSAERIQPLSIGLPS
jgi:nanoRNase/pAp phosphatase (c-di-AMP/oligoRNAs hydrolase)